MSRYRNFIFTYNNYGTAGEELIKGLPRVRYLIYGRETAPTTGTAHLQGYVVFANARTLSGLRSVLPGVHIEVARGSHGQCREYCAKDGDFYEFGDLPAELADAGAREKERWSHALQAAKDGKVEEIPADIVLRHYGAIKRIGTDFGTSPLPLSSTCGIWIWGPAGCGKTRAVFEAYPEAYPKGLNKWWCGYRGEATVLLDDIDVSVEKWIARFLKLWSDRYPFIGESKGGSVKIRPAKFIVTSQYKIEDIFNDKETREALLRRFIVIEKKSNQNIII